MDKTLLISLQAVRFLLLAALFGLSGAARAEVAAAPGADAFTESLVETARRFAMDELAKAKLQRVELITGRPDARLRLSPCLEVKPYLPVGVRLWGKARIGLRCVKGITPWNIYLPITVNVFGPALVSTSALAAGQVLSAADFRQAEVNLAEDTLNPPIADSQVLLGRTLAKAVAPGESLRASALKARQWFVAGDRVQIRVAGSGFAVAGAGEAVTAGLEGQPARVRTESGRVVSGMPVADRQLELAL